jgi:hypothetical protein
VRAEPRAPVEALPPVDRAPLQSPLAVQDVALVLVQLSVADPPWLSVEGVAVRLSVGTGVTGVTVTVVLVVAVPPAPVQAIVNVVVPLRAAVVCVPDVAFAPVQPPDATHDVAFEEDQFRIDDPPCATAAGFAANVTVGAGGVAETATVADRVIEPPAPVQVSVNEYVRTEPSVPVDCEPLVALLPVQSPDAAHDVALVELQLRVETFPCMIALGLALTASVGGGTTGVTFTVTDCDREPPAPVQVKV